MDVNEAKSLIHPLLTKDRYDHTLRVAQTASQLAKIYNESSIRTELAALLHDYAKCKHENELKQYIIEHRLPADLLEFNKELWHGPVAAHIMKHQYNIDDKDVLHAIQYHTTGRAKMSRLELIIFVADYIEPGRSFPGVVEVRNEAKKNLHGAAWMALRNTIPFLIEKKACIHPDTFHAYNDLTKYIKGDN